MSTVTDVLRTYPRVVAALRDVVEAVTAGDPTADEAIARLDEAVAAAEQLLAEPANGDAGRDIPQDKTPAETGEPAGQGAHEQGTSGRTQPAKKKAAKKSTAKAARRPRSTPQGEAAGPAEKRCPSCATTKAAAEFGKNRSKPDGLATQCKPCHREAVRRSNAKHASRREPSDAGDKEGSPVGPVEVAPRPVGRRPVVNHKGGSSGAERPLPGEPTFTTRLVCTRCRLDSTTTHPPADDRVAIAEMWRRVEQAVHSSACPGELTLTVSGVDNTGPLGATPTPRPMARRNSGLV